MRFRRRQAAHVTAEQLIAELRKSARADSRAREDVDAQLEGLRAEPGRRVRLQPRAGETVARHALYLVGTVVTFAERIDRPIDRTSLRVWVAPYCVGVAERCAHPERALPDEQFGTHTYAMVRAEKKVGRPMPVAQEEVLGSWLASNLGLRPTENIGQFMARRRARRLAKLFPDPLPNRLPLPGAEGAEVVVPAPGSGPGNWAGAASAILVDGTFWLTYRVRRPLTDGRGVSVVVASSRDGVHFDKVAEIDRDPFVTESFERPALVPVPGLGWRLYLSCATPDSKHWWVDSLTAATPAALPDGVRRVVLPGDERTAVKDPVVVASDDGWEMWICCHPLDESGEEDRMTTRRLTSPDGLDWTDQGEVLAGRPGEWDARGARVTTILDTEPRTALYDGRPDAASNWCETTGLARWDGSRLVPVDDVPLIRSPHSDGAFRYASAVPLPDGRVRYYVEVARPDGAHDLVTCVR